MSPLALLHTSCAHPPTFNGLGADLGIDLTDAHRVDESLLARSVAAGAVTDAVREDLRAVLVALQAEGARAVMCTCSTIGDAAEEAGREIGLPTVRVDRAMVELAIAAGGRLLVAACLQSTVGTTEALIRDSCRRAWHGGGDRSGFDSGSLGPVRGRRP